MPLTITFSIKDSKLTVEYNPGGGVSEIIVMVAKSGGWDDHKPLPTGKWLITENPSGNRAYFGLFFKDGKINDQFRHDTIWRDGIRFGFHRRIGSHGCIMTQPDRQTEISGDVYANAFAKWSRIQELVRTAYSPRIIRYQNNENPARRDPATHRVISYGDLTVLP